MSYVDREYYDNDYLGIPIDDADEFKRSSKRATEIVDGLTNYRIKELESMPEFIQTQVKKAACAQIEHYEVNGGYESMKEMEGLGNVSLGPFSYGSGSSNTQSDSSTNEISAKAIDYLRPTGLLYSGVATHGH